MTTGYTGLPVDPTLQLPYSLANLLIEEQPVTLPPIPANKIAGVGITLVLAVIAAILVCAL